MFAEILAGLCFLSFVSYIQPVPNHEKIFAVGKSGPKATFNLVFLGLGWPWIGEFVGFIIIKCSPTQQKLVNRKHRSVLHVHSITIPSSGCFLRCVKIKIVALQRPR